MRNILLILFLLTAGVFTNKASAQAVILKADTVEVSCISTDTFLVPVRLENFTNISGLQFTLQWDTAKLDYAFITDLHPQFQGVGFDTLPATIAQGILTFAWTDLAGISLPANTVLFNVAFSRIGGTLAPISFINDPTAVIVFDDQFNELLHETYNGAVKPLDTDPPTILCPANVITGFDSPIPIQNIAPVLSDNCGTPATGWTSTGATVYNFPNDPDASGAFFNIGSSIVTYTTTDAGGNTASCSFEILIEFSVSTTDLTLIANPNNLASCGETVTIDVLAFNFDSIAGLQFSMEWLPAALEFVSITNPNAGLDITLGNFNTDSSGVGLLSFAWTSGGITGSSAPPAEVLFTLTFNVLGSGNVNFGNNPTAALAFTGTIFPPEETTLVTIGAVIPVTDSLPPTITCPADITVQGLGATAVSGISPVVADNCGSPLVGWSVSGATIGSFPNDPDASGALFNLGTSTVTYATTDAGGNTASCSFNVTVEFGINTTDLVILANSTTAACGGSFSMDFSTLNFETVAGVQFTINWDPALYQYTSISNFNLPLGIDVTNFGVDSTGVGFITFAWTSGDLNGLTAANGDVLFSLNFDLLANTPSIITFGDDPTVRVAFDGGVFDEIPMLTIDGTVNVLDTIPPTITCPSPAPVDAPQGTLSASVNGLQPLALTDNCGGIPTLMYTQTGPTNGSGNGIADGIYNSGTTTVIYTATDLNGNTATCSFQVVVNAETPVILQLDTVDLGCSAVPAQVTVNLTVQNFIDIIGLQFGLNWDPAVLELVLPVTIHYITQGPSPVFVNQTNGTLTFFGGHPDWPDVPNGDSIMTMVFNVLDANALANTTLNFVAPFDALNGSFLSLPVQTFNGAFVFNLDNVPPVVTCPSDTVLVAPGTGCEATYIPVTPMATDDCSNIATITVAPDTTLFYVGTPTNLVYTVTDEAGNASTCSILVTVIDTTAPQVIGCPIGPILVDADSLCQALVTWTPPSFQDACDTLLTITCDYSPGTLFTLGTTLVNCTATDVSGNSTTCSFEVVVRDVTPPSIACPQDTLLSPTMGCSAVFTFGPIVATDNCDTDMNVVCSDTSGTTFTGVTVVSCVVIDDAGNVAQCLFTVSVRDTLDPIFPNGCPPNDTIVSASGNCGANPTWLAPTATDDCDQNLTVVSVPSSGTFLAAQSTPYTITYTATDDLGNTSTCTFQITVQDVTAPVLANCPTLPVLVVLPVDSCTVTLNWTAPTATDNCGGVTLTSNLQPGIFTTGDTMVVYTATDSSGNVSTCAFNISVKDVVPPVIDCPSAPLPVPVPSPCGVIPVWNFPLASDNCTPDSDLVIISNYMPGSTFLPGTTVFVVRVEDASGNFAECQLTVNNNVQPGFINVPGPVITITTCDSVVTWNDPIPVDLCQPVILTVSPLPSGSVFPFGTTTVIYLATDSLGNTATATFNVVVSEGIAPAFDCPVSPVIVNVGGVIVSDPSNFLLSATATDSCDAVTLAYNLPNATDNCVVPTVSLWQGIGTGMDFPIGFNDLVFQAVDSSGNISQCAVFVQVVDLAALDPVVDPNPGCLGEVVTIMAADIPGATYTWQGPVTSNTNTVTINSLSSQNAGTYIVSAVVNGCSTPPDTTIVFLTSPPEAMNDLEYTIDPGQTITFSSVFDNDLLSPAFDFSICDTTALPGLMMNFVDGTFTYTAGEEPGMVSFIYNVCSRTCDLEDQAAVTITINDTKCVFIPNIITPNGDDTNDWFTIPCLDTGLFPDNSLVVYSQWGDKVFEAAPYSNDPNEAWRGTLNGESGKDVPDGVYFYIFKAGNNIAPMKGFLEVFR